MSVTGEQPNGLAWRRLRLLSRSVALLLAVVLLLPALPWAVAAMLVPAASPYVAIGSTIAARSFGITALVGLPFVLAVLWRRRWFCRHVCPVGLLLEQAERLSPVRRSYTRWLPSVGRWIALAALGGAIFGYPLLLWLDPLSLLSGTLGLFHKPYETAAVCSAAILGSALLLGLVMPGAWCVRLCPLGATQEILAGWQNLAPRTRRPGSDRAAADVGPRFDRRGMFRAGLGAVLASLGARLAVIARAASVAGPIRPPGAVDEDRFGGLCIRCGSCIRACPADIVYPEPGDHGLLGLFTPAVRFTEDYCREDCHRCTQVCPSGAIASLSLEVKRHTAMGLARVDMQWCLLAADRECNLCRGVCTYDAVQFAWNDETYTRSPVIDPDRCTGCGACQVACPGSNDWEREHLAGDIPVIKAIEIVPRRDTLPATPKC